VVFAGASVAPTFASSILLFVLSTAIMLIFTVVTLACCPYVCCLRSRLSSRSRLRLRRRARCYSPRTAHHNILLSTACSTRTRDADTTARRVGTSPRCVHVSLLLLTLLTLLTRSVYVRATYLLAVRTLSLT
jgi:hypothetical protein